MKPVAICAMAAIAFSIVTPATADDACAPMPVTIRAAAPVGPPRAGLTVASLNIAGEPRIQDALAKWIVDRDADVILLQEVGGRDVDGDAFAASVATRLGYSVVYAPADRLDGDATTGLAILSRVPIEDVRMYPLTHFDLRFRSRCRIALEATVSTAAGPVRVANVHLDTRINSKDRVSQLEPLMDALDEMTGAQMIGGDFNTMDVGWFHSMWPFPFVQHQVAAVRDRMAQSAFHTPFTDARATFKVIGLPFHLDWLYLKQLEASDWSVDDVRYSDHRGVWAHVTR